MDNPFSIAIPTFAQRKLVVSEFLVFLRYSNVNLAWRSHRKPSLSPVTLTSLPSSWPSSAWSPPSSSQTSWRGWSGGSSTWPHVSWLSCVSSALLLSTSSFRLEIMKVNACLVIWDLPYRIVVNAEEKRAIRFHHLKSLDFEIWIVLLVFNTKLLLNAWRSSLVIDSFLSDMYTNYVFEIT